jgi:hypothetical protein
VGRCEKLLGTEVDSDLSRVITVRTLIQVEKSISRLSAIVLVLLMSPIIPTERFESLGRDQTDWYSRGIIRGQTIRLTTTRQKRQQYLKRRKRKVHASSHRHPH